MKLKKTKFILLAMIAVFCFFFSNDFGIIDIEKTAIITAVAIDVDKEGGYEITAQIAVPEATDANTENLKAHLSGTGKTVGAAIKNIGDISGWFPSLSFCNIIIVGTEVAESDVIRVLDYFSKTLRVQDSALVVLAEGYAKDVLTTSTPLDNISSFALQKIIYKNPGFDNDIVRTDIKSFCTGYYAHAKSGIMPLVKILGDNGSSNGSGSGGSNSSGGGSSNGSAGSSAGSSGSGSSSSGSSNSSGESNSSGLGGGSANTEDGGTSSSGSGGQAGGSTSSSGAMGGNKGSSLFDARTTALFYDGVKVGELEPRLTVVYNALMASFEGTTLEIDNAGFGNATENYLMTVLKSKPKITLSASENDLTLSIALEIYGKISDMTTHDQDNSYAKNTPLPVYVKEKAEEELKKGIEELVETSRQTGCDIFNVKQMLYRFHHKYYARYKDNLFERMKLNVKVNVHGQT